jgi:hypothetical protein
MRVNPEARQTSDIGVRGSRVLVTRQRFYLPQLDGLRFFAFLAVFYLHFMEHTRRPGGGGCNPVWMLAPSGSTSSLCSAASS